MRNRKLRRRTGFYEEDRSPFMIYDYFRVTGSRGAVLDCADMFAIPLRGGGVREFDTRWDEILLTMNKIPPDDILESTYKLRIRESDQLKTVSELYDLEMISKPDYQKLKTMVKRSRSVDQKLRLRNFDARNETIQLKQEQWLRIAGVKRGVERGPGECYQWKAKGECPIGDSCSFRHDENKRAKSTLKAASPSEPSKEKDGRSISLRGRSPSGKFHRQLCRDCIKGKCTRPSCDY